MNKRIEKFNIFLAITIMNKMVKNIRWLHSYAWLTLYIFMCFACSWYLFHFSYFALLHFPWKQRFLWLISCFIRFFFFFIHLLFWHIGYRVFLWLLPKAINWFSFSLLLYNTFYTTHIIFTLSLKIDKFNGTWPLINFFLLLLLSLFMVNCECNNFSWIYLDLS